MAIENAIDHLAEEIEGLEHVSPWARAFRWIGGGVLLAGFVGWVAWTLMSPSASSFSSRKVSYVPSGLTPIDVSEPLGATLNGAPVRFAWESVTGRLQYIVRVYVKGDPSGPVFERATTATSFELLPEERVKFAPGTTYVWTVVAQGKNGAAIGAGQSGFRIR